MAGRLLFKIYTLLMLSCVKSCFPAESIQVSVPQTIPAGYVISKVNVDNCDTKSLHFTLSDPDFTATSDGTIVSTVMVTFRGQTFSVRAQDASGQNSEMKVNLVHNRVQKRMVADRFLKRSKRRWSPPPFNVLENGPPPFPQDLGLIGSDSQAKFSVYYIISGPGVTENPVGVFSVAKDTGMLRIHKSLDREEFPVIVFVARVLNTVSHIDTDNPLNVTVNVEDVNDNSPQFASPLQYTVLEHCQLGTVVGAVKATDRDQENTLHTKIKYTLLPGQNLFSIHPETGVISTAAVNLDREVQEKHFATVLIQDMYGETSRSLSSTGTATILLGDINDNPPTFSKTSYTASIEENKSDQCILRIPVEDKDLINTPNWNSEFLITQGNENNNFRIERDPKTNEGLLYVVKPLDFERQQSHRLMVKARNTADLTNTKADWPSVPVNVSVVNVDEGPEFTAPTVRFIIKENTANGTLIGTYTALDPETKSGTGIKYYKTSDPASWVKVDMNTGQLRVANTIDRESHFVQDGIYNVTMKAVDASSKTGTGTVIIAVEDVNDNMPELPTGELVLCEKAGELVSLPIVAKDLDQSPFSAPFSFELGDKSDGKWTVKKINDTAAILQHTKELPTGLYTVPVAAKDLQGFGRTQMVHVRICQCRNGACVTKPKSILLGPLAILAMLLPLLLLLLLGILLALFCVTKEEKRDLLDMGDSGGVLLKSNIEAPGEEVDSRLILDSTDGIEQKKDMQLNSGWIGNKSTIGRHSALDNRLLQSSGAIMTDSQNAFFSSQYGNQFGTGQFGGNRFGATNVSFNNGQLFQDSSVYKTWQTNGCYIQEKLVYLGSDAEDRYADDIIHSYGYEGRGSAAGSVGCCSDQGNDDNLDFINTLGPKFKTLAEVCTKMQ